MTSTPLRTAGSLFGIDLAGLFKDDENGEGGGLNLQPFLQFTNTGKGRGGVLSFRPQRQTGTTSTLGFGSMGGGINNINVVGSNIGQNLGGGGGDGGDDGGDPPTTTPDPDPITGPFPDFDYSKYGEAGYGMKDVYALLDQGATGADIRALGARAKDQGLNVGRRAQQLLNRSLSEDYADKFGGGKFKFAEYGQPGFGMKDIDYVLDQGGTLEDIRRLSYEARDKGLNVGPRAQALLEQNFGQRENAPQLDPEPKGEPKQVPTDYKKFADYDFASQGAGGFGMKDIDYLTGQGANVRQLRALRDKARKQGLNVGPKAMQLLQQGSQRTEGKFDDFDVSAYGQSGFGMKDIQALLEQGATRKDIKQVGKRAQAEGLNVGPRAQQLFLGLGGKEGRPPERPQGTSDNYAAMEAALAAATSALAGFKKQIQESNQLEKGSRSDTLFEPFFNDVF